MKIEEILGKYDRIRLATPEDNSAILDLYESITMKSGGLVLKYTRKGDFFRFLKEQGRRAMTYLVLNEDKSIQGMASYVITDAMMDGQMRPVGYMCDARVARTCDQEAKRQWRAFYVESVENSHQLEEFENCEYMFSAILDANKVALRAFTKKDSPLEFVPTQNYQAQQIIGRKWFSKKQTKYSVRNIRSDEANRLKEFIIKANSTKCVGLSEAEFDRRTEQWQDLNVLNFMVCEDTSGQWVAVTAPVAFTHSRSLVVDDAPQSLIYLSKAAKLFGGPCLEKSQDIKTTYLTHLEFSEDLSGDDQLWCVRAFVDEIFSDIVTEKQNMLSFVWPKGLDVNKHASMAPYLMQKTSGTYYQVFPKCRKDHLQRLEQRKDFSFEVALA